MHDIVMRVSSIYAQLNVQWIMQLCIILYIVKDLFYYGILGS